MRDPDSPVPEATGGGKPLTRAFTFSIQVLTDPISDTLAFDREWNRVFTEFDPRLRAFFGRRVDSGDVLDDLVSHIWRKALRKIGTLRAPEAMWAWLLKIGENKLKDLSAARMSAQNFEERFAKHVDASEKVRLEEDPYEEVFDDDFFARNPDLDRDAIQTRINALSERDRRMLEMHQDGEGHDSIVKALEFPSVEASRQHLGRLKKKLRGG